MADAFCLLDAVVGAPFDPSAKFLEVGVVFDASGDNGNHAVQVLDSAVKPLFETLHIVRQLDLNAGS